MNQKNYILGIIKYFKMQKCSTFQTQRGHLKKSPLLQCAALRVQDRHKIQAVGKRGEFQSLAPTRQNRKPRASC